MVYNGMKFIAYNFTHSDGDVFYSNGLNLKSCRAQRDRWLKIKQSNNIRKLKSY